MVNILVIHGAYGSPEENWIPWLKKELESLGHTVIVPKFPTPENQTLDKWLAVFEEFRQFLSGAIVVGHSLGVAFLLNILESNRAKAAFFVAGVSGPLDNKYDPTMTTFSHRKFDWNKIRKHCRKFYVFHSDSDPYIPLEKGQGLADNLGVRLIFVSNAGHFNAASGYTTFSLLLDKIKEEL